MTRRQMLGFFALCLWSSAGWLIDDALSLPGVSTSGQGFRLLVIGLGALAMRWRRHTERVPSVGQCVLLGAVSLGLQGLPVLLLTAAGGRIASTSIVLLFALLPVLLPVLGSVAAEEPMDQGVLLYGLLGLAGLMVLLPLQLPSGVVGVGLVLLAIASTACCMIWLHRLLQSFPLDLAVCAAGIGNGLLLLAAGTFETGPWSVRVVEIEVVRCVLVDLPETMLLVWLTKTVAPQRLSARFLVVPLLTVMEGLALIRPRFEVRTLVGVALLGVGAYWILRFDSRGQETSLRLG